MNEESTGAGNAAEIQKRIGPALRDLLSAGDLEGAIMLWANSLAVSREEATTRVNDFARSEPNARIKYPMRPFNIDTSEQIIAGFMLPCPSADELISKSPEPSFDEPIEPKNADKGRKCSTCGGELTYGRWGDRGGPFDNVFCGELCKRCDWRAGGSRIPPFRLITPKPRTLDPVLKIAVLAAIGASLFAVAAWLLGISLF